MIIEHTLLFELNEKEYDILIKAKTILGNITTELKNLKDGKDAMVMVSYEGDASKKNVEDIITAYCRLDNILP